MTMTYTHLKRVMGCCSLSRSKIKYLDPAIFNPYLLAVFLFWLLRKTWFSVIFCPWLVWAKLKWWKEGGYQMNIFNKCLAINVFPFNPDFGNLIYGIVWLFSEYVKSSFIMRYLSLQHRSIHKKNNKNIVCILFYSMGFILLLTFPYDLGIQFVFTSKL